MHFCREIFSNQLGLGGAEARREIVIRKPPALNHAVVVGDRIMRFYKR